MFVVFAAVLAWGDLQTRSKQLAGRSTGKRAGRSDIGRLLGGIVCKESTAVSDIVRR
jgi:hypothetical protein